MGTCLLGPISARTFPSEAVFDIETTVDRRTELYRDGRGIVA